MPTIAPVETITLRRAFDTAVALFCLSHVRNELITQWRRVLDPKLPSSFDKKSGRYNGRLIKRLTRIDQRHVLTSTENNGELAVVAGKNVFE
ncbi:hypothetical protein FisN_17Hu234 [Fistulifera solaris]|uniref:Uncharacterized protein n=1 Tax=Fistulifera solaris TaxID=1519565 RepID=A0A1Z5JH12_FISSO|nr:hypothetical protein FisN_17Hu234 [Fistulifera solaris]|eukprot:GAX13293.1 hypothetical protein FisN_17Hu234 [Fistulifera solaris]